jgi:hypothetical protein
MNTIKYLIKRSIIAIFVLVIVEPSFARFEFSQTIDSYRPTDAEYMWMSDLAYSRLQKLDDSKPTDPNDAKYVSIAQKLKKEGWEILYAPNSNGDDDASGYYGLLFYNEAQRHAVISNRGTSDLAPYITAVIWPMVLKRFAVSALSVLGGPSIGNWAQFIVDNNLTNPLEPLPLDGLNDFQIVLNKIPVQFSSSVQQFIAISVHLLREKKYPITLSYTGHSLGGLLGQLSLAWANCAKPPELSGYISTRAVVFDSPGARDFIERDICKCANPPLDITVFVGVPNLVNTYGVHIGRLVSTYPLWQTFMLNHRPSVLEKDNIKSMILERVPAQAKPTLSDAIEYVFAQSNSVISAADLMQRTPLWYAHILLYLADTLTFHDLKGFIGKQGKVNVYEAGGNFQIDASMIVNNAWPKSPQEMILVFLTQTVPPAKPNNIPNCAKPDTNPIAKGQIGKILFRIETEQKQVKYALVDTDGKNYKEIGNVWGVKWLNFSPSGRYLIDSRIYLYDLQANISQKSVCHQKHWDKEEERLRDTYPCFRV